MQHCILTKLFCVPAICDGGCGSFATCVKPGKCKCKKGYFGKNCRRKAKHQCLRYCMKSCPSGKCTCPKYGKSCEKGESQSNSSWKFPVKSVLIFVCIIYQSFCKKKSNWKELKKRTLFSVWICSYWKS